MGGLTHIILPPLIDIFLGFFLSSFASPSFPLTSVVTVTFIHSTAPNLQMLLRAAHYFPAALNAQRHWPPKLP